MTGRSRLVSILLLIVIALVLFFGGAVYWLVRANGFSARTTPTPIERVVTSALQRWSVPARAKNAVNPVPFSPEVWAESRAHFADHCATCHGNDGRGDTEMGRGMFPRAPDMRLPSTQSKTDGQLYWIIENGVRLTGMPAWGAGGPDDVETWKLVHFIRHLSELTPDQLNAMAAANPKSPAELEEEQEDERFLAGDGAPAPAAPEHHHH